MLPKENRLKKKSDFENVFKRGRGLKEKFLFLKLAKNGLAETRFGFAVGRKVSPKAVIRNKVKRRLRGLVMVRLKDAKKGFDVAVVAGKGAEAGDTAETAAILGRLFKKAGLLNN